MRWLGWLSRAARLSTTPTTAHMSCSSPTEGTPLSHLSNTHRRVDHLNPMTYEARGPGRHRPVDPSAHGRSEPPP